MEAPVKLCQGRIVALSPLLANGNITPEKLGGQQREFATRIA
jgi:hypothetical protein